MKKLLMGLFAVGLVFVLALPAAAFDNEFGGYWRTRAYTQGNFAGDESGSQDLRKVDTRTRLFYTAVFSEDFKFVNKFEFNLTWGDTPNSHYGEISESTSDRSAFRIKNSYANFNVGAVNFMIGLQPRILFRGFLCDADFAGAAVTYNGPGFSIPFIWMKAYEAENVTDGNDYDADVYALKPTFTFGGVSLTPTLAYLYSKNAMLYITTTTGGVANHEYRELGVLYAGLDADVKFGNGSSAWFTGIYESGSIDRIASYGNFDVKAYLLAVGGKANFGAFDIHGQAFYATGDDANTTDKDEAFVVPQGQMYYWAEIMGLGVFDNQTSANSCGDKISNIEAANIGIGLQASDTLAFKADLWNARLVEAYISDNETLGTEIDLTMTYALMKNLNLDLVGAYMLAGSGTYSGAGETNPYEFGAKLSFSF